MISTGAKVKETILKEMMKNNKGKKGIFQVVATVTRLDTIANSMEHLAKRGYFASVKSQVTNTIKEKQE